MNLSLPKTMNATALTVKGGAANAIDTTQILLDALRPQQTPAEWESAFVQAGVDWDDLVIRAIVLGLAPQLHIKLSEWRIKIPPRAAAKLSVTYRAQVKRSDAIYTQLADLLAACEARNLHPIGLKGVHLAATAYAEPALRPMNDIDLLFPVDELPEVEAMLAELGYGGKHKSAEMGAGVVKHTSTFLRKNGQEGATSNPYLSANSDRMIEPHGSLEESWFGLRVDITAGVRERAETAVLTSTHSCLVLNRQDLLLHIALHFCFHLIQGAPAMVQLTDLLVISQDQQLDWDKFVSLAKSYRAAPYAYAGLKLAHDLLGAAVPLNALNALAAATPSALRGRIMMLGLRDILQRTQQKPLTSLRERVVRGWQDRAETARWAADWNGRLQVWLTLFQPGKSDTGQMILRKMKK